MKECCVSWINPCTTWDQGVHMQRRKPGMRNIRTVPEGSPYGHRRRMHICIPSGGQLKHLDRIPSCSPTHKPQREGFPDRSDAALRYHFFLSSCYAHKWREKESQVKSNQGYISFVQLDKMINGPRVLKERSCVMLVFLALQVLHYLQPLVLWMAHREGRRVLRLKERNIERNASQKHWCYQC